MFIGRSEDTYKQVRRYQKEFRGYLLVGGCLLRLPLRRSETTLKEVRSHFKWLEASYRMSEAAYRMSYATLKEIEGYS
jgi:hypothetical protein